MVLAYRLFLALTFIIRIYLGLLGNISVEANLTFYTLKMGLLAYADITYTVMVLNELLNSGNLRPGSSTVIMFFDLIYDCCWT